MAGGASDLDPNPVTRAGQESNSRHAIPPFRCNFLAIAVSNNGEARRGPSDLGMKASPAQSCSPFPQEHERRGCVPRGFLGIVHIGAALVALGCAVLQPDGSGAPSRPVPPPLFAVLAGAWEYEEGAVVIGLTLDEQGMGSYPFKGGRFLTTSLADHEWRGRWVQSENDREGEFLVQLTPDMSEGEGRWWYTRIGSNRSPSEKGGRFRLSRNGPESLQADSSFSR